MDRQWGLDSLLADLQHARQRGDLGRLAYVAYCDVRRWAREAGRPVLADQATRLIIDSPHLTRDNFLTQVDQLVDALEALRQPEAIPDTARRTAGGGGCSSAPLTA